MNCIICGKHTQERSQIGHPLHADCLGVADATTEFGPNHKIPIPVRQKAGLADVSGHSPRTVGAGYMVIYHLRPDYWLDRLWSELQSET